MRYFHLSGGNGYCGCDWDEYIEVEDNVTDIDIVTIADDFAIEYAQSYEHAATGWDEDFESEEDRDEYYDSISDYTSWEEITEEEYKENI